VNDPSDPARGDEFVESSMSMDVSLFRATDATFEKGPWISVSVSLLDRFDRANFEPFNYVDQSQFRKVKVGGLNAAIGKNFDDSLALLYGPVNDGFAVSISALGVPEAALLAIAEEITLEEDGATATPVFGKALSAAKLEPFMRYTTPSWGGVQMGVQLPVLFGGDPTSTSVGYTTSDTFDEYLSITNQPMVSGFDALELARFVIADGKDVTVRNQPARAGTMPELFGQQAVVVWAEGGRLIVVTGTMKTDELVDIADAVTVASDDEWAAAFEEFQANQEQFEQPPESWLISSGDLDDGTTWLVEAGVNDNDELALCGYSVSASGSSGSGCNPGSEVTVPSIVAGPMIGMSSSGITVVAIGALDESMVLRYTADDGDITETALRSIRAEWEFTVGALLPTAPGTAELIGADGRVIVTKEFSDDDFDFNPQGEGLGGVVEPATTAVAVEG
jgi:hypothetical protein